MIAGSLSCGKSQPEVFVNPLKIEPAEMNFGVVMEGQPVQVSFSVTNIGKNGISLVKLAASCPCTSAEPEKSYLGPGETTAVRVSFGTRGHLGDKTQYVTVTSDEPGAAMTFKLAGTVRPWLYVDPTMVRIPFENGDAATEQSVKISNLGDGSITIRAVTVSGKNIGFRFAPAKPLPLALKPGQAVDFIVTARAAKPGERIEGWLDIETVEDLMKHHQITVRQDANPPPPQP